MMHGFSDARARLLANDPRALAAAVADDRDDISGSIGGVPMLLYAGLAGPVHEPASRFAAATGARFVGLPERNDIETLLDAGAILPDALNFLGAPTAPDPTAPG